jgi:hypothetical protein
MGDPPVARQNDLPSLSGQRGLQGAAQLDSFITH